MMTWPVEAVWETVFPLLPGFTVEVLPTIDSTNSELMRRVRRGRADAVLLVAEQQTAGRGRLGRSWQGAKGESLMFSLGLPLAPIEWSGLSLAVGVALAESLHPRVQLKWPNDLWVDDRKLGGILIETASFSEGDGEGERYAVIGVGLNVTPRDAEGLSIPPACLQELDPELDAGRALLRLAEPLAQALNAFQAFGFELFQARFNARDVLRGRPVQLSNGTAGTARGASESGALLVHTALGLRPVTSSEVSVRPAFAEQPPCCA